MGLTNVSAEIANPLDLGKKETLAFLVDSGAAYSVIPEEVLQRLGVEASGERTCILANGQLIKRTIGEVRFTFEGESATCVVLFGGPEDATLLGVTTLENLGLIFDPIRQKILSLPVMLAEAKKLLG